MNQKKVPLMIINVYTKSNASVQLPIYDQDPFKWNLKDFTKKHAIKEAAIPFIKQAILNRFNYLRRMKHNSDSIEYQEKTQQLLQKVKEGKKNISELWLKQQNSFKKNKPVQKKKSLTKNKIIEESFKKQNMKKSMIIIKKQQIVKKDQQENFNGDVKEYQIQDLQQHFNKEVNYLKLVNLININQKYLRKLFNSLTKFNPTNIKRIHTDYINFDNISQSQLISLQHFFQKLTDQELGDLSFENMKKFLLKYNMKEIVTSLLK